MMGVATRFQHYPWLRPLHEHGPVFGEDGVFETLTVLVFLIACTVLLTAAANPVRFLHHEPPERRRTIRIAYLAGALLCFGIAMEELSWGQRLLGFETPELISKHNAQLEFNVHNMLNEHRVVINTGLATTSLLILIMAWFRRSDPAPWFFQNVFPHASLIICAVTFGFAGALDVLLPNEVFEALVTVFVAFYAYRIYKLGNP
mgnify:CR=1 FL=1